MIRWNTPALVLAALAIAITAPVLPVAAAPGRADSLAAPEDSPAAAARAAARSARLRALDEACRAAPRRVDLWLEFGRACDASGRFERARDCYERVSRLAPDDPAVWTALGESWKTEWLAHLDRAALEQARRSFERATELDPSRADAWSALAATRLLKGDPRAALDAALRANAADPGAALPKWMLGASLFRLGALTYADSAFRAAQRQLPGALAEHEAQSGFRWAGADPDLTTPENEAELDYLARLGLVWFLFTENGVVRWDKRAELFARYGPPEYVEFNPAAAQLGWGADLEFHYAPDAVRPYYAPLTIGFPFDVQVWHYTSLGMAIPLWDRFLTREYELPYSREQALEPAPDPAALAARPDMIALADGRGVFHAMPPTARPLALEAGCAQFPSGVDVHLLGSLRVRDAAADSFWGAWALVDSMGRIVARQTRPLDGSSCEPRRAQVASFGADLAAGDYRVDFAAWDRHGRRGVQHRRVRVAGAPPGPALSDLVLLCGAPAPGTAAEPSRLEPAYDGRVAGSQLTLYCEIDRLLSDPARPARFSYRSAIYALDARGRRVAPALPVYDATREEQNVGAHRRQFVTAPIQSLAPGPYEMVLEITDLANASTTRRTVRFVKESRVRRS